MCCMKKCSDAIQMNLKSWPSLGLKPNHDAGILLIYSIKEFSYKEQTQGILVLHCFAFNRCSR